MENAHPCVHSSARRKRAVFCGGSEEQQCRTTRDDRDQDSRFRVHPLWQHRGPQPWQLLRCTHLKTKTYYNQCTNTNASIGRCCVSLVANWLDSIKKIFDVFSCPPYNMAAREPNSLCCFHRNAWNGTLAALPLTHYVVVMGAKKKKEGTTDARLSHCEA